MPAIPAASRQFCARTRSAPPFVLRLSITKMGSIGESQLTTCNKPPICMVRKFFPSHIEREALGGIRMWRALPHGAARNWGKLAWSYKQGRVQIANIIYERKYRGSIGPAIGAFFKYLSEPTEYRPSYHPITAANRGDLKKDSVNQIELFVKSGNQYGAKTACPSPHYSRCPHDLSEASATGRVDGGFSRRIFGEVEG